MKPEFSIIGAYFNKALERDGYTKAFVVDTNKAEYQGHKWKSLSEYYKRKFENILVLSNVAIDRKERIKILYN